MSSTAGRLLAAAALALQAFAFVPAWAYADPASPGAAEFGKYCAMCHGANGDGTGPAARLHKPPPANLRLSTRSDEYKARIIRVGGAAMGRSAGMPPWGQELDEPQIRALVAYLRRLKAGQ